jgi:ribosomal protein S27AE
MRVLNTLLICPRCGEKMQPGDTTIIKIPQPRFEERKHCCPNCGTVIAIEIGPNDETQKALPILDDISTPTDHF